MAEVKYGTEAARGVFLVTPNDTTNLAISTRRIRANASGVITLIGIDGVTTACNFLAGESRDIQATRILATGTTCTGIEGEY